MSVEKAANILKVERKVKMKVDYEALRYSYYSQFIVCRSDLRCAVYVGISKSIIENKNYSDSQKVRAMKELIAAMNIANA